MSRLREPVPARAVFSVLSARWEAFWPELLRRLEAELGPADIVSEPTPFVHTSYYEQEMGAPLSRRLLSFVRLVPQDRLADLKLLAMDLERDYALPDGRRAVNIDPGLVTQERLVLGTGKNFTHRVYQGRRVWADLTLIWQRGRWRTLPWTFADYGSPELQTILTEIRKAHRRGLDSENAAPSPGDPTRKGFPDA